MGRDRNGSCHRDLLFLAMAGSLESAVHSLSRVDVQDNADSVCRNFCDARVFGHQESWSCGFDLVQKRDLGADRVGDLFCVFSFDADLYAT